MSPPPTPRTLPQAPGLSVSAPEGDMVYLSPSQQSKGHLPPHLAATIPSSPRSSVLAQVYEAPVAAAAPADPPSPKPPPRVFGMLGGPQSNRSTIYEGREEALMLGKSDDAEHDQPPPPPSRASRPVSAATDFSRNTSDLSRHTSSSTLASPSPTLEE